MADRSVVVRLRAEVDSFRQGMNAAAQAAQQASNRFDGMEKAGRSLAVVGGIIAAGVGLAVKAYAEFDEQMSKVQAATHASASDMALLREAAINAGADTAFSAKEAGQAIEELSKAGVTTKEILGGGLNGALALAAAGSIEVADAAELAATAMTQFGLHGKDIPHLADLLAAGAGKAQGSVQDLGMALKQGGLVAASMGMSVDETVGSLAAFASAGLLGSDAGTSLKTSLLMLANPSKEAAGKMRELGINAYDAQGNFVGMAKLAGNLQASLGNLSQEQRNQALATIFGSDAIRVANILFEQGADGIQKWTNAVNDAGYAAITASMQQNNLKGDLEKLSGSIDSVMLKSGSGLNDMLRGLAQGAERVVDVIGQIPAPILSTALSFTGLAGAALLAGGGLLTLIPKISEARDMWRTFTQSSQNAGYALKSIAKGAGIALAAIVALQVADAVMASIQNSTGQTKGKIEDFNQALLGMRMSDFDKQFSGIIDGVNGAGEAFTRLTVGGIQGADDAFRKMFQSQPIARLQKSVDGLDQSMSGLVKNGGLARAGEAFRVMSEEADKSAKAQGRVGMSQMDVLKLMPSYTAALKDQAQAVGYRIKTDEELVQLARGEIPAAMQATADANGKLADVQRIQKGVTEENAKALAELGLNADGTTASFGKLLNAMFATGMASMSARDAEAAWQEELAGLKQKIDEVNASQSATNQVLDATTGSFNLTSEAGRAANAVFSDAETKARNTTKAMAENGATQGELQAKLGETYTKLFDTARAFGVSEAKADDLARAALGIPKGVPIETAVQNYADTMAKLYGVKAEADSLNGKRASIYIDTFKTTYEDRVVRSGGNEPSGGGLYGSDQGSANFKQSGGPIYKALGGSLPAYHAAGRIVRFVPNGTDTIPVMATPGEFMVKRSAARSLGHEKLAIANATGRWPGPGGSSTVNQNVTINEATDAAVVGHEVVRRLSSATI